MTAVLLLYTNGNGNTVDETLMRDLKPPKHLF